VDLRLKKGRWYSAPFCLSEDGKDHWKNKYDRKMKKRLPSCNWLAIVRLPLINGALKEV
jgi:hypothetical protein